ncbi:hypothetical protein [Vibrio porteresiae]|uniref:Uncharacterized protein n=1 Tax=Vibrio porteresiae DSM 19223 TaxID=1123496 RepID=A0ABZ0QHI9_9VIBR|nr:hypothetical protein [Vibrio porteresiae]WPC75904.1 hypothetical protein R8Z52_23610 [Vibrio porteresiae DSM 19223]
MKNYWYPLSKFLYEKENDNKSEKFKTYLSPYFVPKAYRVGSDKNAKAIIEFKYLDVKEDTVNVTHPENHRMYFEIGKKTKRIYKIYFYAMPLVRNDEFEIYFKDIDRAFNKLSNKFSKDSSDNKYIATLEATKKCLSSIESQMALAK